MVARSALLFTVIIAAIAACEPAPPPISAPGCLDVPPPQGTPVARVGDVPIVVDQIADDIRAQGSAAVRRYSDPARMRQFVEDQVRFELLVRAGLERGLQNDPDVVDAARKVMVRKLLEKDMLAEEVFPAVDDDAIVHYYEQHKDEYVQPEKRRFSEIQLVPTEEGRALAVSLIETLRAHPDDHNLFRMLSLKHSLKKQPKTVGLADLFSGREEVEAEYGPSFAADIFTATPNIILDHPVQSTRGWHVVELHAVRAALARAIDEVREDIEMRLQRGVRSKVFEEYLTGLKKRHPVVIYEGRIDDIIQSLERDPTSTREARR